MKELKNKRVLILIFTVILMLILLILGIFYIKNKSNVIENVRIISDDPSVGTPSRIIYNNKEYLILSDDNIYSIKYYNGKLYYYKSSILANYLQEELEVEDLNVTLYEFGEITLNENAASYNIKAIEQISYAEYDNGDKEEIKYCVDNADGKYKLEIVVLDD